MNMINNIDEVIEKLLNDKKVKDSISKYNEKEFIISDDQYPFGIMADDKDYLLLLLLGVPIGMYICRDSLNNVIDDYSDDPIGDVNTYYVPINNVEEYEKYCEEYNFVDLMVNPNYMTQEEIRHILYCTSFANDKSIFDISVLSEMQREIVNQAPLNYDNLMKIYNHYFDDDIRYRFINDFKVGEDRFYELSGLERIINKNI